MIEKSHAKVNIYLKIVGIRGNYHLLSSRFMRVNTLYDTLSFKKKEHLKERDFSLEGNFGCNIKQNTIYKAYQAVQKELKSPKVEDFFKSYVVHVDKQIPTLAGLGGGSSNAAAFLRLLNRTLSLGVNKETLAKIGASVGADVPFFIYEYPSATVSGIGEKVERYEEEALDIETMTPDIGCDTAKVYQTYRAHYHDNIDLKVIQSLLNQDTKKLLQTYDADFLNDLFAPAKALYPALANYHDNNFFSGSGSTFFRIKHG
jgi:4-diphosphocytidyl-2-C-methyl-D-erythritol kinase